MSIARSRRRVVPSKASGFARGDRRDLLASLLNRFKRRRDDFAHRFSSEMGAPITLARSAQTLPCIDMLQNLVNILQDYPRARASTGR